jgi:hypothetical protein
MMDLRCVEMCGRTVQAGRLASSNTTTTSATRVGKGRGDDACVADTWLFDDVITLSSKVASKLQIMLHDYENADHLSCNAARDHHVNNKPNPCSTFLQQALLRFLILPAGEFFEHFCSAVLPHICVIPLQRKWIPSTRSRTAPAGSRSTAPGDYDARDSSSLLSFWEEWSAASPRRPSASSPSSFFYILSIFFFHWASFSDLSIRSIRKARSCALVRSPDRRLLANAGWACLRRRVGSADVNILLRVCLAPTRRADDEESHRCAATQIASSTPYTASQQVSASAVSRSSPPRIRNVKGGSARRKADRQQGMAFSRALGSPRQSPSSDNWGTYMAVQQADREPDSHLDLVHLQRREHVMRLLVHQLSSG